MPTVFVGTDAVALVGPNARFTRPEESEGSVNRALAAFDVTTDYTVKHQEELEDGRYIATTQS